MHLPQLFAADPAQGRRLGSVARLFAALLVLTLVARGTSAATMPRVTTATPQQALLTASYRADGTVQAGVGQPFRMPAGLLVTEVCVTAGQRVESGDVIARFDPDDLALTIQQAEAQLKQSRLSYEQSIQPVAADAGMVQSAQRQLQSAYDVCTRAGETLAAAQTARDEAAAALDQVDGEDSEAWQAAQDRLAQAEAALTAAESEYNTALAAAQSAENVRNSALEAYQKAEQTAAEQTEANRVGAGLTLASIAAQEQQLARLRSVRQAGGAYLAPFSGTLVRLDVAVGGSSPDVGGLLAPDRSGEEETVLTFTLPGDWAARAAVGTAVRVSQNQTQADVRIEVPGQPAADGAVELTLALPKDKPWQPGAAGVRLNAELGRYYLCLPPAAIRSDGSGSFVYVVQERQTVLGLQNVLVRVPVSIEARGDDLLAVAGALSGSDKVVVGADRPLSTGARVRMP